MLFSFHGGEHNSLLHHSDQSASLVSNSCAHPHGQKSTCMSELIISLSLPIGPSLFPTILIFFPPFFFRTQRASTRTYLIYHYKIKFPQGTCLVCASWGRKIGIHFWPELKICMSVRSGEIGKCLFAVAIQ